VGRNYTFGRNHASGDDGIFSPEGQIFSTIDEVWQPEDRPTEDDEDSDEEEDDDDRAGAL